MKAIVAIDDRLPNVWKQKTLEMVQFSRLTLSDLIDSVYYHFKGNRFIGELIFVDVPTAGMDRCVERAFIREKLMSDIPLTLEKRIGDKRQMARDAKDEVDVDSSRIPEDPHHYRIQLLNYPERQFIVSPNQMRRDRQSLSKISFKKYIKDAATKEKWLGSPWHVKVR